MNSSENYRQFYLFYSAVCRISTNLSSTVSICDESRTIASDYEGGLARYPAATFSTDSLSPPPPVPYVIDWFFLSPFQTLFTLKSSNRLTYPYRSFDIAKLKTKPFARPSPPASPAKMTTEIPLPLPSFFQPKTSILHSRARHRAQQNTYSSSNGIYAIRKKAQIITDPYILLYIQFYCRNIARFMDYMVPTPLFQRIVPAIALTEPALLNAIVACGAFTVSHAYPNEVGPEVAIKYYNEGNALLLEKLKEPSIDLELCTLTAILLTVYEIFNSISFDQRLHLMAIQSLLQQFTFRKSEGSDRTEFTSAISEACFIMVLHMDIFIARMLGLVPLYSPQQWGPMFGMTSNAKNETSVHYWYLKIVYLISKALHINLLGIDPTQSVVNSHNVISGRRVILNEIYEWARNLPPTLHPLFSLPVGQSLDKPFPDIYFPNAVCALAHTFYHIAIITLCDLQTGREATPFRTDSISDVDSVYHARSLCGIVINNENMTMGLITLWSFLACSKYIQTLPERKAILAHLEKVRMTGWSNEMFLQSILASWGGPNWESQMRTAS